MQTPICQEVVDVIQGGGSGGAMIWIGYVVHDPAHRQDYGWMLPLFGTPYDGQATAEGSRIELEVPPFGCGYGGDKAGGGGDLF